MVHARHLIILLSFDIQILADNMYVKVELNLYLVAFCFGQTMPECVVNFFQVGETIYVNFNNV
jgi:hypothetical protein